MLERFFLTNINESNKEAKFYKLYKKILKNKDKYRRRKIKLNQYIVNSLFYYLINYGILEYIDLKEYKYISFDFENTNINLDPQKYLINHYIILMHVV